MENLGPIIKSFRRNSNLTQAELADKLGISKAAISQIENNTTKPSKNNYEKLNEILKFEEAMPKYKFGNDLKIVHSGSRKTSIEPQKGYLPYYDMKVTAGPTGVYSDEQLDEPLFYMDIPLFRDCTQYFRVSGDSMYPTYRNGDIVACKKINNKELILWGETYLIITKGEDYRTIKILEPGLDGAINLISENPKYKPVILNGDQIYELYIVRGTVSNQ